MTVLREHAPLQNANIMGWGMPNPMPVSGQFSLEALDERVAMMTATAQTPVLTLCCAPDWMKGGKPGQTDWSRLEVAPLRSHFNEYAKLAATIAARYPDVRHFIVWNELKGFFDRTTNKWDAEAYTDLYNTVWTAIKAVRPDARIGGPYVVLDSHRLNTAQDQQFGSPLRGPWGTVDRRALEVIDYWLAHKVGADFIVVDGSVMPRQGELTSPHLEAMQKFEAANLWIRSRTLLPIWWAELYPVPPTLDDAAASQAARAAVSYLAQTSAAAVLFWDPVCSPLVRHGRGLCLWAMPTGDAAVPSELVMSPEWNRLNRSSGAKPIARRASATHRDPRLHSCQHGLP